MKSNKPTNVTNFQEASHPGELNELASETQVSQAVDLASLIKQSEGGVIPMMNMRDGVYTDADTPDLDKMDFAERFEYRENLQQEIDFLKEEYHRATKALERPVPDDDGNEEQSDEQP